jgi:hypothetical protein
MRSTMKTPHSGERQVPMSANFAEIVIFRLAPGTDGAAYLEAPNASREWYTDQPGFLSSELIAGDDDQWLGILRWERPEDAEAAAHRLMEEVDMSPYMNMIDPESVTMVMGQVVA